MCHHQLKPSLAVSGLVCRTPECQCKQESLDIFSTDQHFEIWKIFISILACVVILYNYLSKTFQLTCVVNVGSSDSLGTALCKTGDSRGILLSLARVQCSSLAPKIQMPISKPSSKNMKGPNIMIKKDVRNSLANERWPAKLPNLPFETNLSAAFSVLLLE